MLVERNKQLESCKSFTLIMSAGNKDTAVQLVKEL